MKLNWCRTNVKCLISLTKGFKESIASTFKNSSDAFSIIQRIKI